MSEPMHIDLTEEVMLQDEKPKVILTCISDKFKRIPSRIVYCSEEEKYVKEVRKLNAMGELIWVFDESWHADNHNNSFSGFRLCEIIRFLCSQKKKG